MSLLGVSREILDRILEDAYVWDIDFSRWNDQIVLVVDANHVRPPKGEPVAMFRLCFVEVREFVFRVRNAGKTSDGRHPRLLVSGECLTTESGYVVDLNGPEQTTSPAIYQPMIRIECESIRVESSSQHTLEALSPGFLERRDGLVRQGIEVLARQKR